jgi:hypothetical protein
MDRSDTVHPWPVGPLWRRLYPETTPEYPTYETLWRYDENPAVFALFDFDEAERSAAMP